MVLASGATLVWAGTPLAKFAKSPRVVGKRKAVIALAPLVKPAGVQLFLCASSPTRRGPLACWQRASASLVSVIFAFHFLLFSPLGSVAATPGAGLDALFSLVHPHSVEALGRTV